MFNTFKNRKSFNLKRVIAGVTFWLPSSSNEDSPMNLDRIIYNLWQFFEENNIGIHYQDIQTSGDSDFEGTIFIPINTKYVKAKAVKDVVLNFMNRNSSFFEFGKLKLDSSMTMSFDVIKNKTKDILEYPDMSISNGNFHQLAELLKTMGVDGIDDYGAEISIEQLKSAISSINNDPDFIELYTRDSSDSGEEGEGARIVDFGLSSDQIRSYFTRLQGLIDFAEKNKTGDQFILAG